MIFCTERTASFFQTDVLLSRPFPSDIPLVIVLLHTGGLLMLRRRNENNDRT